MPRRGRPEARAAAGLIIIAVPVRATKRGAERTRLARDCDVLICGASFAGLAVARELEGSGASVLMIDRYEIGERQTSACAAPTEWLENLALEASIRQTFDELVIHTEQDTFRYRLPWTFSTFDYRQLCQLLRDQSPSTEFETAKVESIVTSATHREHRVETDRGELRAPLVVDGLGWRRVLAPNSGVQPPKARLSRGLEVHPNGSGEDLEIWIDRRYIRAGYAWSFPAGDEVRVGVGSFEPRDHVKDGTLVLADDLKVDAVRYQGNWIPHKLRPADRGRRLLRRRLRRPLPAADGRGDPHGAVLRDRPRPGASPRDRRPDLPRAGARAIRELSARDTRGSSPACCTPSMPSAASTADRSSTGLSAGWAERS